MSTGGYRGTLMPTSPEKEIKVRALRELIKAGYHNSEIVDALADRYDITPEMIRCQRKHLQIPAPKGDNQRQQGIVGGRLGSRCPKCGGLVYRQHCIMCGLTNESGSFADCVRGGRVKM